MRKSTNDIVIRRLAAAYDRKDSWPDEARTEFARQISDLNDEDAIAALDWIEKNEEWRPTIAKFRAETIRLGRNRAKPTVHENHPRTAKERAAAAFFAPRLKRVLAGIGNGPQLGAADQCDAIVKEWKELQADRF